MAKIVLITRIFNHFLAAAFINIKKNNEPGGWKWEAEYPDKSEELKISENTEKCKWNLIKDIYGTKTGCLLKWTSNYISDYLTKKALRGKSHGFEMFYSKTFLAHHKKTS